MAHSLREGFAGDVYEAGEAGFEDAARPWNATIATRPSIVARCRSTQDVVAALRFARDAGLEVAVRCGGHNVAGTSTGDGGLLIDLGLMDSVDVDPLGRRARVQGGALLGAIDRATQRHGLATVAGMVSHTGVGGLTLGGGYGHLARLHGLACDNVISAEVVTAEGRVVTASEDEHPDLLWGIRGGGGNFGIVTSFDFALHPLGPDVLTAELLFAGSDGPEVLRAFRDFAADAPREVVSVTSATVARASWGILDDWIDRPVLAVEYTYSGTDFDAGARLADRLRLAPIWEEIEPVAYLELQTVGDASWAAGRRRYWKGRTLWDLTDDLLDTFASRAELMAGTGCGVELVSLGGKIADVAEDATAYSNRDATFDFLAVGQWDDAAEDERHIELTRENWGAVAGTSRGGVYVNNLGTDAAERVREAYGPAKYERLVELKDAWDPENVFHLNANIRPSSQS